MHTIQVDTAQIIQVLRKNSYFNSLSQAILSEIAQGTQLACFNRGEIVFWEGEECTGLHAVEKGSVKLFKLSPQGQELVVRVLEEGATFNEVPVFDNGLNPISVAALEDSEIWIIEAALLRRALARYPELAQSVIANLTENLRTLLGMVEELSFFQVVNRLARLISQMPTAVETGAKVGWLTRDELAARLGTVREVVTRSLRVLERSGAIRVNRRQVVVLDEARLREWAQGPWN